MMKQLRKVVGLSALATLVIVGVSCSSGDSDGSEKTSATTAVVDSTVAPDSEVDSDSSLLAGSASASVLPTVNGTTDYLSEAPGWNGATLDPNDIGVYVESFDQGSVDVGNGSDNASWVHDDIRATALALDNDGERAIVVAVDVYLIISGDSDEIVRRARELLPEDWQEVPILINATHNHHGPDSVFSINDDWYSHMADVVAGVVVAAVADLRPATATAISGEHRFGMNDSRDPVVFDPRLNVLNLTSSVDQSAIATVVQWSAHPEVTLGWNPPDVPNLDAICLEKGWDADSCSAEGRYLTADYPGVLRERLQVAGFGEILYLNGALGNQVGPGGSDIWNVTTAHPIGDGWNAPMGAEPVAGCEDLRCRNLARTEAIGAQLAQAVTDLLDRAEAITISKVAFKTESFYTNLTNIGFRLLIADGDLAWQDPVLFVCEEGLPKTDATCVSDNRELETDPVLTPLTDSEIRVGNVLKTRISFLDLGSVGFIFMPGEIPPELVIGLPEDFDTNTAKYYLDAPGIHAEGVDYEFPGYLTLLVERDVLFTVGLGTEALGYWVPVAEYRLKCLEIALPVGVTCADLNARGIIEYPDAVGGLTCKKITDDAAALAAYGDDAAAVAAVCRYGQALGRELGEPEGHYEETNAAGWDLVDDMWDAATRLFGAQGSGRINPDNPGYTIQYPPN
ncbi:MAG: hypothetical protein O3B91_06680 [Actinomycetota bacterium]|nr:hypothetical protein [Actinomycetota bacterium]